MSLFSYKKEIDELSSVNAGISQSKMKKISTTTDKLGPQFFSGDTNFKFHVAPGDSWLPSQSYIRLVVKLKKPDATGTKIDATKVGFGYKGVAGLYNDAYFSIQNQEVCRIQNNLHATEALWDRLNVNKNQKNGWELNAHADVANANVYVENRDTTADLLHEGVELFWRPCLPLFTQANALPSGDYNLRLTHKPDSLSCIRGLFTDQEAFDSTAGVATDTVFEVLEYNFMYKEVSGWGRIDSGSVLLDFENIRVQATDLSNGSTTNRFHLKPNTHAISVAFADKRVKTSALSEGKFSMPKHEFQGTDLSGQTVDTFLNKNESRVKSLKVNYAGVSYPQTAYTLTNTGKGWKQMYLDMLMETGQYWSDCVNESFDTWLFNLGPHLTFHTSKSGDDRSTECTVDLDVNAIPVIDLQHCSILCADHYKSVCRLTYVNGIITQVEAQES